jgi:hypothetical protein
VEDPVKSLSYGVSVLAGGVLLASCAVVDQFEDRIYSGNLKSQNAMNQETLVNIIRASRFQTMNFVALTQVTGGLQETLTTGLPTITIGPAQTVAQHQFQVANSLSSQATGGFQSNPLVSTNFQAAMLSPASPRTVALLASSHPREPVFYSLVDSISLSAGNFIVRFENDETRKDNDPACERVHGNYTKSDLQIFEGHCNYSAFVEMLWLLLSAGLTSELIPVEGVSQKDAPQANGHICFDRSRAVFYATPYCGQSKPPTTKVKSKDSPSAGASPKPKPSPTSPPAQTSSPVPTPSPTPIASPTPGKPAPPKSTDSSVQRLTIRGVGTFDVMLSFRSPVAVFRFYGALYGQQDGGHYRYQARPLANLLGPDEPFIDIISGSSSGCYTSIDYGGQPFCVPSYSSNTALIFTMLQELRNLSIQSTDLNSAFTVRLSN